ncbi:hypothetical protein CspHIS471_0108500 [Cutaneotrichosporon sp. HIS471]|nr:hypothetical protein CspHIS471_0108500 [Cutaneotrichosporon sp. HIS471]
MASIEIDLYPHIWDAILSYTRPAELPKMLLVCRALRIRIGRIQCTHLVLSARPRNDVVAVRAARPVWGDYSPTTERIPGLRTISPISWGQLPPHPAIDLTVGTQVLDIKGFVPPTTNLTGLAFAFPALKILRMRTCPKGGYTPYLPVPAPTVVLFTNSQGEDPDPVFYDLSFDGDDSEDESPVVPEGVRCGIPEGTRKLVINMKGNDVPIADMFQGVLDPPKSLRELALVIPAYTRGKYHGRMPGIFMDHIVGMDTIELFMAYYDEECTFTIVGADEVLPGYNLRGIMADHLRKTFMFGGLKPPGNGPGKAAKIKEVLDLIQFISRGEYIARVGKRIAELETVERL